MPAPKTAKLFARTYIELREIDIFLDNTLKGCWAVTYTDKPGSAPYIIIHPKALEKPHWFQELLIHELVHVLESLYDFMLRKKNPSDCTQYAIVVGRYLAPALRDFELVGPDSSSKRHPNRSKSKRAR